MPVYRSPALQRARLPSIYEGMLPGDNNNPTPPYMGGPGGFSRQSPEHGQNTHDPRGQQYQQISGGNSMLGSNPYGANSFGMRPSGSPYTPHLPEAGPAQDHFPAHYNSQQHFSAASTLQPGYHNVHANSNEYGVSQGPRSSGARSNSYPPASGRRGPAQISLPPSAFSGSTQINQPLPEPEDYLRQKLKLAPGRPVDLWALEDPLPGKRPNYPYPLLVRLAIQGSPNKRLTLKEIYEAIENRFEFYRNSPNGAWKGSIRHNLSLNQVFRNVPRPLTEPGKGNYWEIDHSKGEGYKRDRKRRNRRKGGQREDSDEGVESDYLPSPEFEGLEMDAADASLYTFADARAGPSNAIASSSRAGSSREARRHSPYRSPQAASHLHLPTRPFSATGMRDDMGYDYPSTSLYHGGPPADGFLFQQDEFSELTSPADDAYGHGSYNSHSEDKRRSNE